MKTALIALLASLALTGCANRTEGYPSLAPREVEKKSVSAMEEPVPTAPVLAPSNPARLARLDTLVRAANNGNMRFNQALSAGRGAVVRANGAAPGSDAWISGQMALSRMEAARASVGEALAGLDDERRMILGEGPSQDDEAITRAAAEIEAIDKAQDSALRNLSAGLRTR
jgi:hypothetical protein